MQYALKICGHRKGTLMPLFPQLGNQYYDEKDRAILSRMEDFYTNSVTLNQQFWAEADIDTRFYAGDQSVWNDIYGNVYGVNRRQFSFNRIKRIVEMPCGYQRRNRKSTIVIPIENANQQTADQFTKILMWNNRQESVSETISEAFTGAMISGLNLLQVWMDYRDDPVNGNIKVSNCSYNTFVIDPYFKKHDLSDCNAIWKRSFVTKQQAMSLLPDKAEEMSSIYASGMKDGKFQYMPENYDYNQKNLMSYDEFYYRDYRKQKMIVDTQNGETMEWKGDEETLKMYLATYPTVTVIDHEIPTVNLAIVLNGKTMYSGPNPMGIDQYPFVPVLGYYTPELPYFQLRMQGMVRGLRDAQFLYNRRKIIELDILESQVNSGWIAKENAFVDPKSPYKTGQGQVLWLKEEAQISDVLPIQAANISPSMFQMSEQLGREIMEISGVNEELLGSASDDKAGILSMLRQGAGLTTLQRLFDQLDFSQKLLGRLMVNLIQTNFTPGKIKRIIQEEPSPQFYDKNFGVYDAAIEEGSDTTTQKQLQFAQLLHLREVGVNIPPHLIIEASTLQNKQKLMDEIQKSEQQQQQQAQQQAQMAMQEQAATIEMAKARAMADQGLAQERLSRIEENQQMAIERQAQAEKELAEAHNKDEEAMLTKVKMLKELHDIDIRQLGDLLSLYQNLKKQDEMERAEKEKQEQQEQQRMMQEQQQMQQMMQAQQQEQQPQQENNPMADQPPVMGQ